MIDIFDLYQEGRIGELGMQQADTDRRLLGTADKLRALELRYERMRLVSNALWQLLKEHTGLTDADLKRFVEQVDLSDGKLDGKLSRNLGAMDCPKCSRRVLKSAVVCAWCGHRQETGDAFQST
jgi:hypothetical protein